ncbi:hypothetical protein H5410_008713 [Solanum commersonii]|uniref:Uncharacterized protein n=1 Tax=Solanum commersonii TaxID=4109 RepID=A0A9J6AHJ5_SOLCO|nr:hypothetical protein H5410_008713 [Solanum commersonii]
MEPSTYSEIRVSSEIVYAIGDCPVDDFNLEINQVSVNLQEFELMKARIVAADREYFAELLWKSVHDKIMRVKQRGSSSLYEEFKWIE